MAILINGNAKADTIEWFDTELGVSGGSSTSQSWTKDGFTLNATTTDGWLGNIASGISAGLWISGSSTDNGMYVLDLDGVEMTSIQFEFDNLSSTGSGDPERMLGWEIATGGGMISVEDANGILVSGSTMSDLIIESVSSNGEAVVTVTSDTPFTWFAFRHTQDVSQRGAVIERVLIKSIPAPISASLLLLGGLMVRNRRRSDLI